METSKLKVDRKKHKSYSRNELLEMSKEELTDIIIQLQANNVQLKNVILKKQSVDSGLNEKTKRPFDFSRFQTRRIVLRIAYLGSKYRGLAVQEDSPNTIEAHLFAALTKGCLIKCREESHYHRCGRTDKGVSASGQVLSLEVRSRLSVEELNSSNTGCDKELQYCKILNRLLPDDIRAICWAPAVEGSDGEYCSARFDCKQRTYKYWFPQGSLDIAAMRRACHHLQGSHDFRNLCKMDVANGVTVFTRHITHATIVKEESARCHGKGYDMYYLLIKANAFLWHQIRCIAGVLFLVGQENEESDIVAQLLDIENNPRKPQYNMAIDLPLNLFHCNYDFLNDFIDYDNNSKSTEKCNDETLKYAMDSNSQSENNKVPDSDVSMEAIDKIVPTETIDEIVPTETIDKIVPTETIDKIVPTETIDKFDGKKSSWFVDFEDLELVIKNFQTQWSKTAIKAAMIRDIIEDLEKLYKFSKNSSNVENIKFNYQSDCMLEGVKPKVYKPLLKRIKCESLENRIEHYVKKKRLMKMSETDEEPPAKVAS